MKRLVLLSTIWFLFFSLGTTFAAPPRQYEGEVSSPRPNAVLSGQVTVSGTANHPDFWKYEIRVAPGQNPSVSDDQWYRVVVREEAVVNGQLAVWDTTVLPDGVYTLRLRVVRNDGNWQDFDVLPLNISNSGPPTATPEPEPTETPLPTETAELTPTTTLTETLESGSPTPESLATLTPLGDSTEEATVTPLPTTEGEGEPTPTPTPIIIDQPTIIVPTSPGGQSDEQDEQDDPEVALGSEEIVPPTPASSDFGVPSLPDSFGENLEASTLLSACLTGAAFTAGIFLLVGLLYLLRSLVGIFR